MRRSLLILSSVTSAVALCITAPAIAGGCGTSATESVVSNFVVPEIAFQASSTPVNQASLTETCGPVSYGVISTTSLSTKGTYGDRGYGDEIDGFATYDLPIKNSIIGPVDVELGTIYQKFAPFKSADGTLVLYGEVARPFQLGSLKIAPFVRTVEWIGTGSIPSDTFVRPGLRVSDDLSPKTNLSVEVTTAIHLNSNPEVTYATAALTHDLGHGWNISFTAQATEFRAPGFGIGFSKAW